MKTWNLAAGIVAGAALASAYTYTYTDSFSSINSSIWYQNGSVSAASGLYSSTTNGGSVLYNQLIGSGNEGDVRSTIALTVSGGTYVNYLRSSSNALSGPGSQGSYYAAELQNPTLSGGNCSGTLTVYKSISGVVTVVGTTGVTCRSGMMFRFMYNAANGQLAAYIDSTFVMWAADASPPPAGYSGVGGRGMPAGNIISKAELGAIAHVSPNAIDTTAVASTVLPNEVQMRWKAPTEVASGTGVMMYQVLRNGIYIGNFDVNPGFTDPVVSPTTTYVYTLYAFDFHFNNGAPVTVTAKTPPVYALDPKQIGVRPTGAYWGGGGENIDMRSGNLNFTVPIAKAMGRGNWGVPFALSFNSQLWRKDYTDNAPNYAVWRLGNDVGYGFGWKLQAGTLRPYYVNTYTVAYWVYTDSTGAEYRLSNSSNGVWSSSESIYVVFDSVNNKLYFPDGSFWVMGATSGGTEDDAGTLYPTVMEDTNGNQVIVTYDTGVGLTWNNSSGRIVSIEDVRAQFCNCGPSGYTTYQFTYGYVDPVHDPIPHLTQMTNLIGNGETYTFSYYTVSVRPTQGGTPSL